MKMKRFISALAALTMSVSCFAGLAITASAAATPTVYVNEDYQSDEFTDGLSLVTSTDNTAYKHGDISYQVGNRSGTAQGTAKIKVSGTNKSLEVQQTKFSSSSRGTKITFTPETSIPNVSDLDDEAILRLSFDIMGNNNAQFTVLGGIGTLKHSDLGWSSSAFSTVVIDLNKFTGKQTITVDGVKKSEAELKATTFSGLDFQLACVDGSNNTYPQLDNIKVEQVQADTSVQSANYTIKFVDANSVSVKDDITSSGNVGDAVLVNDSDKADFKKNVTVDEVTTQKKYIFVSDDAESKTIAADGSTVVTVTFREADIYDMKVVDSINQSAIVDTTKVFEKDKFTYSYPKYLTDDNGKITATASETVYAKTVTPNQSETIEVTYTAYESDAWFVEGEKALSGTTVESDAFSENKAIRGINDENGKNVMTVPENGIYTVTFVAAGNNVNLEEDGITSKSRYMRLYANTVSEDTAITDSLHLTQSFKYPMTSTKSNVTLYAGDVVKVVADSGNGILDYVLLEKTGDLETTVSEITEVETPIALTSVTGKVGAPTFETIAAFNEKYQSTKQLKLSVTNPYEDTYPVVTIAGTEYALTANDVTAVTENHVSTFYFEFAAESADKLKEFGTVTISYGAGEKKVDKTYDFNPSTGD